MAEKAFFTYNEIMSASFDVGGHQFDSQRRINRIIVLFTETYFQIIKHWF